MNHARIKLKCTIEREISYLKPWIPSLGAQYASYTSILLSSKPNLDEFYFLPLPLSLVGLSLRKKAENDATNVWNNLKVVLGSGPLNGNIVINLANVI